MATKVLTFWSLFSSQTYIFTFERQLNNISIHMESERLSDVLHFYDFRKYKWTKVEEKLKC